MINKDVKLDFHDLRIKPAVKSKINSRKEVIPYYTQGNVKMLPLMTAPMDTVVDINNYTAFIKNKICPILPRKEVEDCAVNLFDIPHTTIVSFGLDDFIKKFLNINKKTRFSEKKFILIDIANGHMEKLLNAAKKAKKIYGDNMFLIVGNVANPKTFENFAKIGVDAIRLGIGNGGACLTTKQVTIGYPIASLIQECREIKNKNNYNIKIIADGGMKDYSDIILSLALGADYVMLGSILNKSLESCANTYLFKKIRINQYSNFAKWLLKNKFKLIKQFRGMSTKEVQKKWGKKEIKTSEGVVKKQKTEYTLQQWTENFEDYLRSTMSYCNKKTLKDFIGNVELIKISDKAYQRFDK